MKYCFLLISLVTCSILTNGQCPISNLPLCQVLPKVPTESSDIILTFSREYQDFCRGIKTDNCSYIIVGNQILITLDEYCKNPAGPLACNPAFHCDEYQVNIGKLLAGEYEIIIQDFDAQNDECNSHNSLIGRCSFEVSPSQTYTCPFDASNLLNIVCESWFQDSFNHYKIEGGCPNECVESSSFEMRLINYQGSNVIAFYMHCAWSMNYLLFSCSGERLHFCEKASCNSTVIAAW